MNVLVLCTGNSCRSQMAEGFLRYYLNAEHSVFSAGIEKHGMNQKAVSTMNEAGIDITQHYSKTIEQLPNLSFDLVITVCNNANESCPIFPKKTRTIHKDFVDPSKLNGPPESIDKAYVTCRNEIQAFCKVLAFDINQGKH